ncbi:MAG: RidA family protein, partial [Pseudomonadota bacterium]
MEHFIEKKMIEQGLKLPQIAAPAGNYIPVKKYGNLLFVSGQLPIFEGQITLKGQVGKNVTADQAKEAARLC